MKHDSNILAFLSQKTAHAFPACQTLVAYWEALRDHRLVPARTEFDPRGVEASLASTFVAEMVSPSVARLRVAGSRMGDLLGMDVRGMPLSAFFDPQSRDLLGDALRDLGGMPARLDIGLEARHGLARKRIVGRMVLLPMSDSDGAITRLVGCLEAETKSARLPVRFSVTSIECHRLRGEAPVPTSARVMTKPEQSQTHLQAQPAPRHYELAESPVRFRSARRKDGSSNSGTPQSNRACHLKLVIDNS